MATCNRKYTCLPCSVANAIINILRTKGSSHELRDVAEDYWSSIGAVVWEVHTVMGPNSSQ